MLSSNTENEGGGEQGRTFLKKHQIFLQDACKNPFNKEIRVNELRKQAIQTTRSRTRLIYRKIDFPRQK